MTWKLAFGVIAMLLVNAPLYSDPTSAAIRSLRSAGYTIEGRDPCNGSGLCCPLLPAHHDDDVFYVTLPDRDWHPSQLRLLKRFKNLVQIRADRDVDPNEFAVLCNIVGDAKLLLLHVRDADGTRRWTGR